MTNNPKAFISYSWSSREHQQWVLELASQLRENAVDVIIDKWDLKEGHDAIRFMEKMITDPEIKKVIVILDRAYAEKADGRKGGVGTETQIISPEIYAKADQNKFVGVASQVGSDEKPFLPAFYKSRIYIDLSRPDLHATNFDQLLRWIYDKPAYPKPPLGKLPEFLNENAVQLPTRTRANRAVDALKSGSSHAGGAIDEYFTVFAESLEALRINEFDTRAFDEAIIQSINSFLPYRDEYIGVISALARYSGVSDDKPIHTFFERLIPYLFRPKSLMQCSEYYWDNFRFIIHEMFLYAIGFLLKYERFDLVFQLMSQGYYVGDTLEDSRKSMQQFSVLRQHLSSLTHRNKRLKLNRLSLHADMLEQRSHTSGLPLLGLMQADFILFFFDAIMSRKEKRGAKWWPETLLYYKEFAPPFEMFARSESIQYFEKIRQLIAMQSKSELGESFKLFGEQNAPLRLPSWEFHSISLGGATNFEKLATRP
jgi:hypothetical protein